MHKYLSAIGFKHIESRNSLNKLIEFTETSFQYEKTVKVKDQLEMSERIKHFTKDMGLVVIGAYDKNDNYEREHYIPFFLGKGEKKFDELAIERHIARNSYAGACEYPGIGITIIYYLQNAVEYLSELKFHQFNSDTVSLTLSGRSHACSPHRRVPHRHRPPGMQCRPRSPHGSAYGYYRR